ncbi:glycoside hydrolase family 13 protein [Microbacterium sp. G2-8]|uniref:glycoside hydrolase family 13 protein n=1 Tax=Microbacterium sp. G2-8 TaxID=2842454 RepID=UPI001C89A287|nr:glycoside hydrolase family 13 protein [Microbacterium sp. G2-8]
MTTPRAEWWRSAVIYQVYPRSFADADGDGIGDLAGALSRIDHLADLGVDAVWFSPFMPSPQKDAGYDISDYRDIDPLFGTLADFDAFLAAAHERGIRVIVDLVPNHSSDQHPWFQQALAAAPRSPERARYIFSDGKGPRGEEPPNNWPSFFGGSAWTRTVDPDGSPGQWYLHLFDSSQPDFNWQNEEVREEFRSILRFWLDRGADGFRVDVAHGLVKDPDLPDHDTTRTGAMGGLGNEAPYLAQEGVHEIYRDWRRLLDSYDGDRALCAEAWLPTLAQVALWVRPDEMHQAFNMNYLGTPWDAERLRAVIDESREVFGAVGAPSTWVLSNHDVVRHTSRLALPAEEQSVALGPDSAVLPDPVIALRRGRAATMVMLGLPGSSYLYQGEELGLPEVTEIADDERQDPRFFRSEGEAYGRDGCRVPLPWTADGPSHGFNDTGESWLPQPPHWGSFARDAQIADPSSTLSLYRRILRLRREHGLGTGDVEWMDGAGDDVLAFRNGDVMVLANLGEDPLALPEGHAIALSADLEEGLLPPDAAAWVVPARS